MFLWIKIQCAVTALAFAFASVCASRRLMHYFQLESYQFRGYFHTIRRQWKKAILPYVLQFLALFALIVVIVAVNHAMDMNGFAPYVSAYLDNYEKNPSFWGWLYIILTSALIPCVFAVLGGFRLRVKAVREKEKKKFALTARMKRLYAVHAVLLIALLGSVYGRVYWIFENSNAKTWFATSMQPFAELTVFGAPVILLLPLLLPLSALLALPIERLIFHLYFRDAEKKLLENPRLIRIGITGSYGKTSTKFILAEILGQKYNVLATPASFNTPMGVTRIIR